MAGKREKPDDVLLMLRQAEVLQGQGAKIADAVLQIGMTQQSCDRRRREYGGVNHKRVSHMAT